MADPSPPDDGESSIESPIPLLPPTSLSRPILLLHHTILSTSQTRRQRLTAMDVNERAIVIAASNGAIYAYQKPNPLSMLQREMHVNAASSTIAHSAGFPSTAATVSVSRVGLLKLITRSKDAITHIKLCPTHDDIVAVATSSNQILIIDLKLTQLKEKENVLFTMNGLPPTATPNPCTSSSSHPSDDVGHRDRISCIVWDSSGTRLFSGDRSGVVIGCRPFGTTNTPAQHLSTLASASATQSFFAKKTLLRDQAQLVMRAESEVVQMVCVEGGAAAASHEASSLKKSHPPSQPPAAAPSTVSPLLFLAVSTLTRCVLAPLSKPGPLISVGTKARNGPFGVCCHPMPDGAPHGKSSHMLLASRPGKRIWSAEIEGGQVISTLKLKLPAPSLMHPFALPSPDGSPPANASSIQLYHLQPFQHGLLSYYCGDSATAGGSVSSASPSAPPASPFISFIDPHHVLVHELIDMGGPIRQVAIAAKERGCSEIWVMHEPPPAAAATEGAHSSTRIADVDGEGSLQMSAMFAYPADHFLAHAMKLTPSLFPSLASLAPTLMAPLPLPALPTSLAGLFPSSVSSNPSFQPPLDFFIRLAVRHHVHDRSLLTLLRQRMTEAMPIHGSHSAESAGSVEAGIDESLQSAFELLINEAEHMEQLREKDEDDSVDSAPVAPSILRHHSAPTAPTPAASPPPTLPSPLPSTAQASAQGSSSIENLLAKAAHSIEKFRQPTTLTVPEKDLSASMTPEPYAANGLAAASAIPVSINRSASVSLSSSPVTAPGAFLPPAANARLGHRGSMLTPPTTLSASNPFSSNPPPQLPVHPNYRPGASVVAVPAGSAAGQLPLSSPAANLPTSSITNPSTGTPSSGSKSGVSFFKDLIKDVSNEWDAISDKARGNTQKAESANAAAVNAASVAASAVTAVPVAPSVAPASSVTASIPSIPPTATPLPSSDSSVVAPSLFNKSSFLPVSGPFNAPILSPMLGGAGRSFEANSDGAAESAAGPSASPANADGFTVAGKKRRKKGVRAEVALIARAPAKLLPTPFQPDIPNAESVEPSASADEPGELTDDSKQQHEEDEAAAAAIAAAVAEEAARAANVSPLRKARKEAKKPKRSRKAPVLAGSVEPASASASVSDVTSPAHSEASPPTTSACADASPSISATFMPVTAKFNLPSMDGIDPADIEGDDGDGMPPHAAAMQGEGVEGQSAVEGEVEGERDGQREGEKEGAGASPSMAPFASLRAEALSALVDLDESASFKDWASQSSLQPFLVPLQLSEVAHAVVAQLRREHSSGVFPCESSSIQLHAPSAAINFPPFLSLMTVSMDDLRSSSTLNAKPRSRRASLNLSADDGVSLSTFVSAWLMKFEHALVGEGVAPVGAIPHPASATAASLTSIAVQTRAIAAAMAEITAQDPSDSRLMHMQQLTILWMKIKLNERMNHQRRSADGSDMHSEQDVWNVDDILTYIQSYAPLMHRPELFTLCASYHLYDVLDQLHRCGTSSGSDGEFKLLEQLLSPSSRPDQVVQAFQLLRRHSDPSLSIRCMKSAFQRHGSASSLAIQIPLHLALDHAVHLFPDLPPWWIAKQLDVRMSLWACDGAMERCAQARVADTMIAADLSRAPDGLIFHASYLDLSSDMHKASLLQSMAVAPTMLDKSTLQYHCYFHYLRSLIRTHESARRDGSIVLEYIRMCMAFSQPAHSKLFRRRSEGDSNSMVPARDSMMSGVWVHEAAIMDILSQPGVYRFDQQHVGRLCAKVGFHRGAVALYAQRLMDTARPVSSVARMALTRECLLMSVCADDAAIFAGVLDDLLVSSSVDLASRVQQWKFILESLHGMHFSQEAARIAPRQITIRGAMNHMAYSIGSQLAVSLLLANSSFIELCDRAQLPASFYTDLVESAVLRTAQLCLTHRLLESLDSYLWSDRSRNIAPQMRAIYQTELQEHFIRQEQMQGTITAAAAATVKRTHNRSASVIVGAATGGLATAQQSATARQTPSVIQSSSTSSSSTAVALPPPSLSLFVSYVGGAADSSSSSSSSSSADIKSVKSIISARRGSSNSLLMTNSSSSSHHHGLNDYQIQFEYVEEGKTDGGEDRGMTAAAATAATSSSSSSSSSSLLPVSDPASGLPLFYEDLSNQCHWGLRVELSTSSDDAAVAAAAAATSAGVAFCSECSLPLLPTNEHGTPRGGYPAITAFRCRHVFHTRCISQKTCTVCWNQRFSGME